MLLRPDELPGNGWKLSVERTWAIGGTPGPPFETEDQWRLRLEIGAERLDRARANGGVVAVRSATLANPLRQIVVEVLPYASEGDAAEAIPLLVERNRRKETEKLVLVDETLIDDVLSAGADVVFLEQNYLHNGLPLNSRSVLGRVGYTVFFIACQYVGGEWPWGDVKQVALSQVQKITEITRRFG